MSQKNRFKAATYSLFPSPSKPPQSQTTTPLLSSSRQTISSKTPELVPQTGFPRERKSSINLFSIISKFEALDALSLPPTETGLEPKPLQIVNQNLKHKRGAGAHLKRLSTIFSPGRESPRKYEKLDTLKRKDMKRDGENTTPGREAIIYSGEDIGDTKKTSISKSWRYRSKGKAVSPRKSRGSLVGREKIERGEKVEDVTKRRGRSIKDMIRFYDGATPTRTPTMVKGMLIRTPTPQTPVSRIFHEELKKEQRALEKKSPDKLEYLHSIRSGSPHTPFFKIRNGPAPNSLRFKQPCHAQTPNSKTAVRSKSPFKIGQTSPIKCKLPDSNNSSPRHSLHATLFNTPEVADKRVAGQSSTTSFRGRAPSSLGGSQRLSSARVKVGSQIEALYRAKSMERDTEGSQTHSDHIIVTPTKLQRQRTLKANNSPKMKSHTVEDSSPSRVAGMKKLFEKSTREEHLVLGTPERHLKLEKGSPSSPSKREVCVKPEQLSSPPGRPYVTSFSNRTSGISPKTVRDTLSKSTNSNLLASPIKPTRSSIQPKKVTSNEDMPQPKLRRTKSKTLSDRIRLFEDIGQRKFKASDTRRKMRSFSAKFGNPIINSRKSLFELPSRKTSITKNHQNRNSKIKSRDKIEGRSLNIEEVRDIVAEVQQSNTSFRARWGGKRKSQVGRWNEFLKDSATTRSELSNASYHTGRDGRFTPDGKLGLRAGIGLDGRASDGVLGDTQNLLTRASSSLEMVVKEAECGLKEPKPMRLVEMKRMVLLCREKAGLLSDKEGREKNGGGQFVRL